MYFTPCIIQSVNNKVTGPIIFCRLCRIVHRDVQLQNCDTSASAEFDTRNYQHICKLRALLTGFKVEIFHKLQAPPAEAAPRGRLGVFKHLHLLPRLPLWFALIRWESYEFFNRGNRRYRFLFMRDTIKIKTGSNIGCRLASQNGWLSTIYWGMTLHDQSSVVKLGETGESRPPLFAGERRTSTCSRFWGYIKLDSTHFFFHNLATVHGHSWMYDIYLFILRIR